MSEAKWVVLLGMIHLVGFCIYHVWKKRTMPPMLPAVAMFADGAILVGVGQAFYYVINGIPPNTDGYIILLSVAGVALLWLYLHVMGWTAEANKTE